MRGDALEAKHWQKFARECGLNPKQVLDRVGTLARSAIAEAEAAASEVAAMPAGAHEILDPTRRAVERRAHALLAQLQEPEDKPVPEAVDGEGTGRAEDIVEMAPSGSP
jgi:serine/threonine-protein kinase HipA